MSLIKIYITDEVVVVPITAVFLPSPFPCHSLIHGVPEKLSYFFIVHIFTKY